MSPRADRSAWPVRRFRLGEEPAADLGGSTTPEQRLEMTWPLALEAWALTGRPLPRYARAHAPVRRLPLSTSRGAATA
jgi:hypothetical protein